MSLMRTTDVQCDKCGMWTHGCTGYTGWRADHEARRIAKAAGYVKRMGPNRKYIDICPTCQPSAGALGERGRRENES